MMTRLSLALGAFLLLPQCQHTCFVAMGQTTPPTPPSTQHTSAPALQLAPWTGDFDAMLKRRFIRFLVASSKTQYYVVNGVQHGSSYEILKTFEQWVNQKYPQKDKGLRFHVVFIPVARDGAAAVSANRVRVAVGHPVRCCRSCCFVYFELNQATAERVNLA
jgi:hypothetical protein